MDIQNECDVSVALGPLWGAVACVCILYVFQWADYVTVVSHRRTCLSQCHCCKSALCRSSQYIKSWAKFHWLQTSQWFILPNYSLSLVSPPQTVLQYTVPFLLFACWTLWAELSINSLWSRVKWENFVFIQPGLFAMKILQSVLFIKLIYCSCPSVFFLFWLYFFIHCMSLFQSSVKHNHLDFSN